MISNFKLETNTISFSRNKTFNTNSIQTSHWNCPKGEVMHSNKNLWCITNIDKSFTFLGNASVEASQETIEIDNHINNDISENSDDSFHLSQTKIKTGDEETQNSQCNNIVTERNIFFDWDSFHARLDSHYDAWSYKKRKHKKIKVYKKSL